MEINVEKIKIMRISKQPSSIQLRMQQKQPQNVAYFMYLEAMITKGARYTRDIKYRTKMEKAVINKN